MGRPQKVEDIKNYPFRQVVERHVADLLQLYRDEIIALKARVKELEEK